MELSCNYTTYIITNNSLCILNKEINESLCGLYKTKVDENKVIQLKIHTAHVQTLHLSLGSANVCPSLQFLPLTTQSNGHTPQQYPGGLTGFLHFRGGQPIDIHVTLPPCKPYYKLGICSYSIHFVDTLNGNYIMKSQAKLCKGW